MPEHLRATHEDCPDPATCFLCGVFICGICGLAEGSLTTDCPGFSVSYNFMEAVLSGDLDFVNGAWVKGAVSRNSPAWAKESRTSKTDKIAKGVNK